MADPKPPPQKPERQRGGWKVWLAVLIGILLAVFIGLNSQEVEVNFIFGTAQAPLIVALLIAGGAGALIGWLVPKVRRGTKAEKAAAGRN